MAKSDIENMLEWKKRRGQSGASFTLAYDLQRLGELWRSNAEEATTFADFIPMRLVTIIEVFTREAIRELVDAGSPYLEKAEELSKGAKLDFALLAGLQGRKVSIGDLVAHTVSVNEPGRIVAYLAALVPDFVQRLKASHPRWTEERANWPLDPIISEYSMMMANLSRLFTVRHIVTHELPSEPAFHPSEIDGFLKAAGEFIEATDWVLVETLRNAVPRTQTEMNAQAGAALNVLEREMGDLISAIKERGEVDASLLDGTQEAWNVYAKKEAELRASLVTGGSMYSMIWASAKEEETRSRMETLRWWAERGEGDL
ncbi:lysozyme inhibitor LprI family protein [Rhizobium leguminosarum]|uniref:lysozyme inhibitor LprI family protein n=1 Tax=Rhizobium leguminosarum TaxID=384 RepID=UPI003F9AA497